MRYSSPLCLPQATTIDTPY